MAENKKDSPLKIGPLGYIALGVLGGKMFGGGGSGANSGLASAQAKFDKYMKSFEESQFKPLDLSQLQQENVYEDMQVDTTSADYATKQFQQQQASIMNVLKGSAGSSGVAGFAQTLSNQAAQQAETTRMALGEQERTGRTLALQEKSRLQNLMTKYNLANQQGAAQFEQDKLATMLGVQGNQIAGIRQAIANKQSSNAAMMGSLMTAVATYAAFASDRRLKKNIKKTGTSPSGLGIYEFEFKDKTYGEGRYQGTMADEVFGEAKSTNTDGFEEVDYSKIDVDFKKV